ncbi:MAG: hypothetical protein L6R42_004846, partial [Xanthoria sp. 1 TBL-2021]
ALPSQPPRQQTQTPSHQQQFSQQAQPQQPPERQLHQPQKRSSNPYREAMPASFDGPAPDNIQNEDWESNFSKRYPALAGLEMVETEINGHDPIGSPPPLQQQQVGAGVRVKDV